MKSLYQLGWKSSFDSQLTRVQDSQTKIGRVSMVQKSIITITTESGEFFAKPSGKLSRELRETENTIVVGDFVTFTRNPEDEFAIILDALERQNEISRQAAGNRGNENNRRTKRQIMVANVDTVFIVSALDRDYNPRRIERYLTLVYNCGAKPAIILNKVDLCDDLDEKIFDIESIAFGVPVWGINAQNPEDISELSEQIKPGETITLLGSSGVGKSTIINGLLGAERQKTGAISDQVKKGRHTTTTRELIFLPNGGIIIDTPGMREIQLSEPENSAHSIFADIETIAERCRFSDCSHQSEPGCAVQQAVEDGSITPGRLESYLKLQKEANYEEQRRTKNNSQIEKEKWRQIKLQVRQIKKHHK